MVRWGHGGLGSVHSILSLLLLPPHAFPLRHVSPLHGLQSGRTNICLSGAPPQTAAPSGHSTSSEPQWGCLLLHGPLCRLQRSLSPVLHRVFPEAPLALPKRCAVSCGGNWRETAAPHRGPCSPCELLDRNTQYIIKQNQTNVAP